MYSVAAPPQKLHLLGSYRLSRHVPEETQPMLCGHRRSLRRISGYQNHQDVLVCFHGDYFRTRYAYLGSSSGHAFFAVIDGSCERPVSWKLFEAHEAARRARKELCIVRAPYPNGAGTDKSTKFHIECCATRTADRPSSANIGDKSPPP